MLVGCWTGCDRLRKVAAGSLRQVATGSLRQVIGDRLRQAICRRKAAIAAGKIMISRCRDIYTMCKASGTTVEAQALRQVAMARIS